MFKKTRSRFALLLSVILCVSMMAGKSVFAENENDTIYEVTGVTSVQPTTLNELIPYSVVDFAIIQNKRVALYPTFESQDVAIQMLTNDLNSFVNLISAEYNVEPLSEANWKEYNDFVYLYASDAINTANYRRIILAAAQ